MIPRCLTINSHTFPGHEGVHFIMERSQNETFTPTLDFIKILFKKINKKKHKRLETLNDQQSSGYRAEVQSDVCVCTCVYKYKPRFLADGQTAPGRSLIVRSRTDWRTNTQTRHRTYTTSPTITTRKQKKNQTIIWSSDHLSGQTSECTGFCKK